MLENKQCQMVILVTSDLHGHVFPHNYRNNREVSIGLAKLATMIHRERESYDYSILIDNGDLIQGTPLTYYYSRFMKEGIHPMVNILNHLNYDCAVIGNHEFNFGIEVLQAAIKDSNFPWLSANTIQYGMKNCAFGRPYVVKVFENGLRVAILGITTHYIPNWENPKHIAGLQFEDAFISTKKWVKFIQKYETYDLLIISYHGGFEREPSTGEETENMSGENQAYAICEEIAGIDVLLTGHQHRMIADTVNGVTIVQPGCNGQAIGKVVVTFEKVCGQWVISNKAAELVTIDETAEADREIIKMTKETERETQAWLDQPIGRIIGDMTIHDAFAVRLGAHPLIKFLNQVQMDASGARISATALFDNGSEGFNEEVTMRNIVSNYIYPNTLRVIRIKGYEMEAALEKCASYFMLDHTGDIVVNPSYLQPKPQHYNYDMWEGIEYELDIRRPVGDRVTKLMISGEPIEMEGEYEVVMNNYRASGGGDFHMFQNKPVIKEIQTDMTELIADYFLKRKVVYADNDKNWRVIWQGYTD
ncbi:bifunctional metallophosphatase/5'-nucleotidase [Cytobacillus massiliigabonensis]|uniref:bifunctional metallophosphatase/5'-nucleotidase n=1 Tax=Cytobacillus massiliigabonensis TaxID=1871011 RepID=UPI000C843DA8|nr:bifunctional metallophosphatase/5'-nucleotidase [Cytobacillus massiliigabonensis]